MAEGLNEENQLAAFKAALYVEEKRPSTIQKYLHDVEVFFQYAQGQTINRELILGYKEFLLTRYTVNSVNTMLISLNCFFTWQGKSELRVKTVKQQREIYTETKELTKEEYKRLLETAEAEGKHRLRLIMETICTTGIRVSELQYITVEALKQETAKITNKGKYRQILIPRKLCKRLKQYCTREKIKSGPVFVTKNGKNVDRSNIWSSMKKLCKKAGVAVEKVFPHNLRHLFARMFLTIEKDISKLADVLGHTSLNTTRIYTMSSGAEHRARLNQLSMVLLI